MSFTEVTNTINNLSQAWEEFKVINDRRLNEIECKGSSNPLDNEHLARINHAIDECKNRLNKIEYSHHRPTTSSASPPDEKHAIFHDYIRKGINQFEQKSISRGATDENGFPLISTVYDRVMRSLTDNSVMRQVADINTISSDYLTILKSTQDVSASWDNNSVNTEDLPSVTQVNIFTHTLHACPKITQRLLEDCAINIDNWIVENISDSFSAAENTAFFKGNTQNEPIGILNNESIPKVNTAGSTALQEDDIMLLYYELPEEYARNASFIMNRSTVQQIRSIKSAQSGQYIWQPGLQDNPDTLMGIPVYQSSEMPEIAAENIVIMLGDFKRGYKIVDRTGISILRDQFSCKPNIAFYATKRVGGNVFDEEAIRFLQMASTDGK